MESRGLGVSLVRVWVCDPQRVRRERGIKNIETAGSLQVQVSAPGLRNLRAREAHDFRFPQ